MARTQGSNRRHFTDAARAAATAARKAKRAIPKEDREFGLFVVRSSPESAEFAWEIRRYGGLIVQQTEASFTSMAAARVDGERALAKMR